MTIDAYAHCGREKYLPVEALEGVMSETGVECAVLCQHLGQFDNSYLASLLRVEPDRFAGVALVDHRVPGWHETLADVPRLGFRGIRVTSEALRENPGLSQAAAAAGLHQILYAPEGIATRRSKTAACVTGKSSSPWRTCRTSMCCSQGLACFVLIPMPPSTG